MVVEFTSLLFSEPAFLFLVNIYGFARRAIFSFLFHPSWFHRNHQPPFGDALRTETLQNSLKWTRPNINYPSEWFSRNRWSPLLLGLTSLEETLPFPSAPSSDTDTNASPLLPGPGSEGSDLPVSTAAPLVTVCCSNLLLPLRSLEYLSKRSHLEEGTCQDVVYFFNSYQWSTFKSRLPFEGGGHPYHLSY